MKMMLQINKNILAIMMMGQNTINILTIRVMSCGSKFNYTLRISIRIRVSIKTMIFLIFIEKVKPYFFKS